MTRRSVLRTAGLAGATRAGPLATVLAVVAGAALIAAAFSSPRRLALAVAVRGTLPFALVAWAAIVPIVVAVGGALVALGRRDAVPGPGAPPGLHDAVVPSEQRA